MGLTREQVRERSLKRTEAILNNPHYKEANVLYIYLPAEGEIDTEYLIVRALQDDKIVASPIFLSSQDRVFARIDGNPGFRKGRGDRLEPLYQTKLVIDKPGLRVIPFEKIIEEYKQDIHYYGNYINNRNNLYTIAVGYKTKETEEAIAKGEDHFKEINLY